MTQYTDWVQTLTNVGMLKVCVVNRSYQVVGASAQNHIPSAWNDPKTGKMINENQELADPWDRKTVFHFFKQKCNVIQKEANFLVAVSGNVILLGRETKDAWIIAEAVKAGMLDKKKKK